MGKRDKKIISEYKCYIGEGHASVRNGAGHHADSGWVGPENWSMASLKWSFGEQIKLFTTIVKTS